MISSLSIHQIVESLNWEEWLDAISYFDVKEFKIPSDYVFKKRLGLADHMEGIFRVMNAD